MLYGFLYCGFARVIFWRGASLVVFVVLNFPKFWTKILQEEIKKICRRVRIIILQANDFGLDFRLQHALLFGALVSGGYLAILLAGNGWLGLQLTSYLIVWVSACIKCWAAYINYWLRGFMTVRLPGQLAYYWLPMQLAGYMVRQFCSLAARLPSYMIA